VSGVSADAIVPVGVSIAASGLWVWVGRRDLDERVIEAAAAAPVVGCRMIVAGLRLGALLGTQRPKPMCALWAHIMMLSCRR